MNQSIGIVGAKEINRNGTPKVNIDGQWYFANNIDSSGISPGQRIDFEWDTFGDGGKHKSIKSWGLSANQPTAEEVAASKPQERKPWGGKPGGGGFPGRGQDRGLEIDLQCMRFVGQVVGSAIEAKQIQHSDNLQDWVTKAYDAIKFAKSWGATAPAPAQTATPAGPPKQTPQGSAQPSTTRLRPTGNFGWGQKYKETPWHALTMASLVWFRDESNAPAGIKSMCRDEIFFREKDDQAAKALEPQQPAVDPDFDEDIPF